MRNVVFKPGDSKRSAANSGSRSMLTLLMFTIIVLPLTFLLALIFGGDIMLALLTVLVVGAMGYLVLSVFK